MSFGKGEMLYETIDDGYGNEYYITGKNRGSDQEVWFLYDRDGKKLGRASDPYTLEDKYIHYAELPDKSEDFRSMDDELCL